MIYVMRYDRVGAAILLSILSSTADDHKVGGPSVRAYLESNPLVARAYTSYAKK